ncbi:MAG: hypothetical protein KTR35_14830 [Gammaproteobacteria bacterium]|nr:hypothetical protein [Gammaproteobacteria bacterium]
MNVGRLIPLALLFCLTSKVALGQAPTTPGNLRVVFYSPNVAELFWDAATDDQLVIAYQVKRNDIDLHLGNGRSYFEANLPLNQTFQYEVSAIDNSGNHGAPARLQVSTAAGGGSSSEVATTVDTEPPSIPANLRLARYSSTAIELFWDASRDNVGVVGYELSKNGVSLGIRDAHSLYEGTLNPNQNYRYEVVAVDGQGNRSGAAHVEVYGDSSGSNQGVSTSGSGFSLSLETDRVSVQEGDDTIQRIPLRIQRHSSTNSIRLSVHGQSPADLTNLPVWLDQEVLDTGTLTSDLYIKLEIGMASLQHHERYLLIRATDGQTTQEQRLIVNVTPVAAPDIYLLIGQSNMEGYSQRGAKAAWSGGVDQPNDRIRQLNVQPNSLSVFYEDWLFTDEASNIGSPRYIRAEDPLHEPQGWGQPSKAGDFIGLGLSFAKAALPHTAQEIYLVPAAWGASGFCRNAFGPLGWNGYGTDHPELGDTRLTDRALTRLNMVLNDTGGILRGILWHQGEADSNNWHCASQYAENLARMVQRLKTDAKVDRRGWVARGADGKVPFIVGTMSKGGAFSQFGEIKNQVDAVHRNIANLIPYSDYVNADDLVPPAYPCGDGSCIHFGAEALREMGFRYYSALRRVNSSE